MTNKKLFSLFIFAVAFAYIEADTVVYLRYLYYPGIISLFPLHSMDAEIFDFEVYREIATIVILVVVAYISSKKLLEIPFLFFFLFGIWDIFYYIFLYLMIHWSPSILSFDILFLIPVLWVVPVLCPVLISLTLIGGSLFVLKKGYRWMKRINFIFASAGIILILWSALAIPVSLLLSDDPDIFYTFIPEHFPWHFYIPGLILLALGFFFKPKSRSTMQSED